MAARSGGTARGGRRWYVGATFTVVVVGLLAFAAAEAVTPLFVAMLAVVGAGVAFFHLVFPGSRLFTIALANYLGAYACIYVYLVESNFPGVGPVARPIGYILPVLAFFAGAWWKRDEIRAIVTARRVRDERHFSRMLLWLVPIIAIAGTTFALPGLGLDRGAVETVLLVSQAGVALFVFLVSRDVTTFLVDTGLLFEELFDRIAGLVVPAFAFLTFYSLNIIVFGAVYRILDRYSGALHFVIDGELRPISFPEALYFSVVTLSTVGYGDIAPASDTVRVIVSIQIVLGVLLLLFGFSEIFSYSRERKERP